MKATLFIIMIILFSASTIKAQNKSQQDNGQFVSVVQTQKTTNRINVTHYTMTNISSVSMDFTLYKEATGGTWLTTHSLNLNPGQTFDNEGSAIGLTGRYVLYSAPHNALASFPSFMEIAALQTGNAPPATFTPQPANPYSTTQQSTNPYSTPQQPANPYSTPQQQPANPYSTPQQPANPYSTPQQQPANPYSTPQQPANPYSTPQQPANPYTTPQQPTNPYSTPQQPANPYSTPQQPANPYSTPQQPANPYSTPQQPANPYSSPQQSANPSPTTPPVPDHNLRPPGV